MASVKGPRIFYTKCKRCGREIVSSRLALTHPLGQICSKCITPDERQEIMNYLSRHMLSKARKIKNPVMKHWHFKSGKVISHSHKNGNVTHTHYGLVGYGRTSHTLRRNRYDELRRLQLARVMANPEGLYESFHGVSPIRKRKVFYEPPPKELISIGKLKQLNYQPVRGQHVKTEFYHKAGDIGGKMLTTNMILATDKQGRNLYLVRKNKNSKYPVFTARGIIG